MVPGTLHVHDSIGIKPVLHFPPVLPKPGPIHPGGVACGPHYSKRLAAPELGESIPPGKTNTGRSSMLQPPSTPHPVPGQVTFPGETQRSASLPQRGHQRSKEIIPPTLSLGPSEFMGLLTGAWMTRGKLCHRSHTPAWQTTQESCVTTVLIPISHTSPAASPVHTGSSLLWGLWVQDPHCTKSRSTEVPGSKRGPMWEGQGGCGGLFLGAFLGFQTAL